nr:hypothetical protein [Acidobacteriota bacterium]
MTMGLARAARLTVALVAGGAAMAAGQATADPHVERLRALMREHRAASLAHAEAVRGSYEQDVPHLLLQDRDGLVGAVAAGELLPLPVGADAFNVNLRLQGPHQIAELDPQHQPLYVTARPEVLGMLLDIGSRLPLGHLDVTSLVRHAAYQRSLALRNPKARTRVPTHAMGLAVDMSVLHLPVGQARALGKVLHEMAARGDLHYVAEQRQLVFHVVPAAARREHYRDFAHSLASTSSLADLRPWPALLAAAPPPPSWSTVPRVPPAVRWEHGALLQLMPNVDTREQTPAYAVGYVLSGASALLAGRAWWRFRRRLRRRLGPIRLSWRPVGFCVVPLVLAAAASVSLTARPQGAAVRLPVVPAIDAYAMYMDRTPVEISFMAGSERLVARVSGDDLR